MSDWDPRQYLSFADERSRPFADLIARVPGPASTVVDLGCGAGNLTSILRRRWPEAEVTGIDSSPQMIERARHDDPSTTYLQADIATWRPERPVDVIVSNAALQWVHGHRSLLPELIGRLRDGGRFAFQVPGNFDAPSHAILHELAGREPYAAHTTGIERPDAAGPDVYLDDLTRQGHRVDAWETTYLHVLTGPDPVFEWISGTGARPVLQALPRELRARFEREYRAALREAYPPRPYGTVLPFRRVFVAAERGG